jgi:ABC-type sugar transport system permease subunit
MMAETASSKKRFWLFSKSMHASEVRLAWLLILPTAIIVFGLVLFPAIFSIWISFHKI